MSAHVQTQLCEEQVQTVLDIALHIFTRELAATNCRQMLEYVGVEVVVSG